MKDFHFYASSAAQWATTTDKRTLRDLIKLMEADKLSWSLWMVPGHHTDAYEIKMYQPMVQGAKHLEMFNFMNGVAVGG